MYIKYKKIAVFILFLLFTLNINQYSFAIKDNSQTQTQQNKKFSLFKKKTSTQKTTKPKEDKIQKRVEKLFKHKKGRVEEIELQPVIEGRPKIPFNQLKVMTIEDCVDYALEHNPNLMYSHSRVEAIKTGANQQRANYYPRIFARLNYNHDSIHNKMYTSDNDSAGFNAGISEMIWDFGRTTAKINMAKFNYLSAVYDHDYEILNVIYNVKISYYKVLSALADLDIYEQYVRIQNLNYERTKAMFDEGLKSKIDVVNAEVNLADSKIQLVDGQNTLANAIIDLQNAMYYQEENPFIVQNTENFNFLKADYKKKIESITTVKSPETNIKRTPDGLIMLSSGIEHRDIIQNFEFKPWVLSKQEAVNQALELRPDLKANQMLALMQEESLKAVKKQYMPEITGELSWGYTRQENHMYNSPLTMGASIGVGSINPYGIHWQVKEGENYLDMALHNLNIAKSDIYWEVQQNYVNMRQLERKIPLMNSKVKATLENFELADGRYSVGLNNYVELQDALINYNTSQLNFVDAVFKYNVARETLLKSMGVR